MKIDLKYAIFFFVVILIVGFYIGKNYEKSKTPDVVEYACNDKKTVAAQYYKDKVHVGLSDGREYTLPRSASSDRYTNQAETIVFWNKADKVFFQESGLVSYNDCQEP